LLHRLLDHPHVAGREPVADHRRRVRALRRAAGRPGRRSGPAGPARRPAPAGPVGDRGPAGGAPALAVGGPGTWEPAWYRCPRRFDERRRPSSKLPLTRGRGAFGAIGVSPALLILVALLIAANAFFVVAEYA